MPDPGEDVAHVLELVPTHDFIGIGLCPGNLSLACLTAPIEDLDGLFLEARPASEWHPRMTPEPARPQTPFVPDLVTPADPASPYSFGNYLMESGPRLPPSTPATLSPLRSEYGDYCRWAAGKLRSIRYGHEVTAVTHDAAGGLYTVHTGQRSFRARHLVLGTGTPPYVPEACTGLEALHSSNYAGCRAALRGLGSITVVGSGRSAAEIYHDLLGDIGAHGYQLNWVTRSPHCAPLDDTTPSPDYVDYVDYFHGLPEPDRYELESRQKAAFDDIYDTTYVSSARGPVPIRLMTSTEVVGAALDERTGTYTLGLRNVAQQRYLTLDTAGLVLATGYKYRIPAFLEPVRDRIRFDSRGRFDVARNSSIDHSGRGIFLQAGGPHPYGDTSHPHGGASSGPDTDAGRNSRIIRELLGREHYPIVKPGPSR